MLSKFLDPKNDVAFRKIFGSEKNKDILIHFLNDMVVFKEKEPIEDVTFLKTVQDPDIAAQKTSIVDILAKDTQGNQYIVEMQVAKEKGFEKRAPYDAAKAYIAQVKAGGKYHDLKEVIFLAIADFIMFPNKKSYKSDHVILDKESHEQDLRDFSFTFLELPKFEKPLGELETMVDKWAYFFKQAEKTSEEDLDVLVGSDEIMERAYDELNRFSWDDEELLIYDQAEKYAGAYRASMDQKYDEGKEAGRREGEEIGIKKGEEIGIKREKQDLARKMLSKGMSLEEVSEITGLSVTDLQSLNSSRTTGG